MRIAGISAMLSRTWSGRYAEASRAAASVTPVRTMAVVIPASMPIRMSVSIRSPTRMHAAAGSPSTSMAASIVIGEALPTITSTLLWVTASMWAITPAQSGSSPPAIAGPVGVRRREARPPHQRPEGDVELAVVEGPVEGGDDPVDPLRIVADLKARTFQLRDERLPAEEEEPLPGGVLQQVAGHDEGGVDHRLLGRGDPQAGELGRVVLPSLEGLVGEEDNLAAPLPQLPDHRIGAGDELFSQVNRPVKVEDEAFEHQPKTPPIFVPATRLITTKQIAPTTNRMKPSAAASLREPEV